MIEIGMFYLSFTVAGRCFGCGWWRGYKLLDINTWFMSVTVTYGLLLWSLTSAKERIKHFKRR